MARILLVTNDFPPTIGGIQSYVRDFAHTIPPAELTVFASTQDRAAAAAWDASVPYEVIRWPRRVMLPTVATAARLRHIIRERDIDTVWFGAAAPLALLAPSARAAGARTIIASTHGHEVGWSMLPGGRWVLRRIAQHSDIITYISDYTRRRLYRAMTPRRGQQPAWLHLPSAVNSDQFFPIDRAEARRRLSLPPDPQVPLIVCISRLVPRKGQDQLIRAMAAVQRVHPQARLLIVGRGRYGSTLRTLARRHAPDTIFRIDENAPTSTVELNTYLGAATIFAMPARTRGGGLDVEGLGIVYLEAQAAARAVVAGDSGGAPETITPATGMVVSGKDHRALSDALIALLDDPARCHQMGLAGREHILKEWTWDIMAARLAQARSAAIDLT